MTGAEIATRPTVDLEAREQLNLRLTELAETVPGGDGDGVVNILNSLLAAQTADELDRPWNSEGLRGDVGVPLRIDSITKADSQFAEGPGFFLVVHAVVLQTGELVTRTTSSLNCMGQLLVAHANGWFPWTVIPREAERPTEKGYYPMHLEVMRAASRPGTSREPLHEATQRLNARRAARRAEEHAHAAADSATVPAQAPAADQGEPAF